VQESSTRLALDGKTTEAIALVERFVSRNPKAWEAEYRLGSLYEDRSRRATADAAKRRDLETAVKHLTRAAELVPDNDMRFVLAWKVQKLHGADALNDAAASEKYARQLVAQFPKRAEAHMVYAQLLRNMGDIAGAADVMRKARAASTLPTPGLLMTMQYSYEYVQSRRDLSRDAIRSLIQEGMSAAEAILAMPTTEATDFRLATMGKGMGFDLQAERLAESREQRIALLTEADRWSEPVAKFKNGTPPPAPKRSAAEIDELEFRGMFRWNSKLVSDGKVDEAIAEWTKYAAQRSNFHGTYAQIAELHLAAAKEAKDAASRTSRLQQAAVNLQKVAELAPAGYERDAAFEQLLDLYGPAQLNRAADQEAVARGMVTRQPTEPAPHYTLAMVLLRNGKAAAADTAMQAARTAIKPTAATRGRMASAALRAIRDDSSADTNQRLFDEATALLREAEKLNAAAREVLSARVNWLNASADRFEKDPAKAAAQRTEAKRLATRVMQMR
jgi:tetratricopeptide (TPR) repeat protein